MSAETRSWIIDSTKGAAKLTAYLWAAVFLGYVAWQGFEHDAQEKATPTPHEWSWITRYWMREAKKAQMPSQARGAEPPHWIDVAKYVRNALERLEDPNGDGQHVKPALGEGEGAILIEGVGRAGLDVSDCAEPWRRGYFDALMTAGAAAEHVDGFVVDKSRNDKVFPPQVVLGPSNPTPVPMPYNSKDEAPREENCETFFDQPHKYYLKILTSVGFTSEQKLQAALAYADWLGFKDLSSSASHMIEWAMDIADASYRQKGEQPPYDRLTGMLRKSDSNVSSNVLHATNAAAVHLARTGDLSLALPAFLTTLRLMRSLPKQERIVEDSAELDASTSASSSSSLSFLTSFIKDTPYPPPPPSGDLPATRDLSTPCAEAGIIAQIGELLFVSPFASLPSSILSSSSASQSGSDAVQASSPQLAGLAWTKQAVDLAESSLLELSGRNKDELLISGKGSSKLADMVRKTSKKSQLADMDKEQREETDAAMRTCAKCLEVAVGNWQKMVSKLADRERALLTERARERRKAAGVGNQNTRSKTEEKAEETQAEGGSLGDWLWRPTAVNKAAAKKEDDNDIGVWMEEARLVEERKIVIRRLLREEKLPVDF